MICIFMKKTRSFVFETVVSKLFTGFGTLTDGDVIASIRVCPAEVIIKYIRIMSCGLSCTTATFSQSASSARTIATKTEIFSPFDCIQRHRPQPREEKSLVATDRTRKPML